MQLVFEFGSDKVSTVVEAIRRAVGDVPYDMTCLPASGTEYVPTNDTLESAETKLAKGDISAFSLHPREGMVRYALILKPYFDGQSLSLYLGTVEYTGRNYEPIWDSLLATQGLAFVCLGLEEGIELTDDQLTLETFPWTSWSLVIAALRDPPGSATWTTREGPAKNSFAGSRGNGDRFNEDVDS
ncbi:MAG TPA: hypothetical protein VMI32_01275 [Candidatus Solibacter sp.]|nr:hypothetical protein [Candidatus Solibacter sp.]